MLKPLIRAARAPRVENLLHLDLQARDHRVGGVRRDDGVRVDVRELPQVRRDRHRQERLHEHADREGRDRERLTETP
jgi:hypothetical protein